MEEALLRILDLTADLRKLVGYGAQQHRLPSKKHLRELIYCPPGAPLALIGELLRKYLIGSIAEVESTPTHYIEYFRRSFSGLDLAEAYRLLFDLTSETFEYCDDRRDRAMQVLDLPTGMYAWRYPRGPEHALLRYLAKACWG